MNCDVTIFDALKSLITCNNIELKCPDLCYNVSQPNNLISEINRSKVKKMKVFLFGLLFIFKIVNKSWIYS